MSNYTRVLCLTLLSLGCVKRTANLDGHAKLNGAALHRGDCSGNQWQRDEQLLDSDGDFEGGFLIPMRCVGQKELSLLGGIESRPEYYWANGIVHYRFDKDLSRKLQKKFIQAAEIWEQGVNKYFADWGVSARLKFQRDSNDGAKNFMLIIDGQETSASMTGMIGGGQSLRLTDQASLRTMLHEIGHALGLTHEHSRCDRDKSLQIKKENIKEGKESNFRRRCKNNEVHYPYNIESIMHYSSNAFSKNGAPTMVLKGKPDAEWEQVSEPHQLDYATVARGMMKHIFGKTLEHNGSDKMDQTSSREQ